MQQRLSICSVPRTLQNLPGLCMISWATANCAEKRLPEMQISPIMKGMLLIDIQRVFVYARILQLMVQDTIIAAQRANLKNGSFSQSFSLSLGVGLRESRLKSSSRMGKPEQMIPMQMKGLNQLEKSGMPEMMARTKQGIGEFMRLSTPKMSIFFRGSSLQSVVMIQVIYFQRFIIR